MKKEKEDLRIGFVEKHEKPRNHRQSWTSREDNFLAAKCGEISHREIGEKLGRSTLAVGRRVHELGIQSRRLTEWRPDEIEILQAHYPARGAAVARAQLLDAGYERSEPAIVMKALALGLHRAWSFEAVADLSQPEFYSHLSERYKQAFGKRLKHKQLAEGCFVSLSRVQKWFAPGGGQEPLSMQMRHHFWLWVELVVVISQRRRARAATKQKKQKGE